VNKKAEHQPRRTNHECRRSLTSTGDNKKLQGQLDMLFQFNTCAENISLGDLILLFDLWAPRSTLSKAALFSCPAPLPVPCVVSNGAEFTKTDFEKPRKRSRHGHRRLTNAAIHLIAMAKTAGVDITLADFVRY
jgi:hypothetical protein